MKDYKLYTKEINQRILLDEKRSTATSFFITSRILVSNYHVIEGSIFDENGEFDVNVNLVLNGNIYKRIPADVIAIDKEADLCLLRIDEPNNFVLPYQIADKNIEIKEGDEIFIIGFPEIFGHESLFTTGIISGQHFDEELEYIIHSALLFPGFSGSINLSSSGDIIAITTAKHKLWNRIGVSITFHSLIKLLEKNKIELPTQNIMRLPKSPLSYIYDLKRCIALIDVKTPELSQSELLDIVKTKIIKDEYGL